MDPITHKSFEYQNNSVREYAETHCKQSLSSPRLMRPLSEVLGAGLAISMASAIAANACIISRFLEKHVRESTILAMMFLTIHGTDNSPSWLTPRLC
jgi:hypothetical protein